MTLTRSEPISATLIEVLDRILDKGIVIDAWVRVSLVGVDVATVQARVVIASIETYSNCAGRLGFSALVAPPPVSRQNKKANAPNLKLVVRQLPERSKLP